MTGYHKIPTTADIYLEIGGVKVAVVQSYKVTASRTGRAIQAFGQDEPVATLRGPETYTLEFSRIYATDTAIRDGIDFFTLEDFDLVIVRPDGSTIYTGCQWVDLQESAEVGSAVVEQVRITAAHRLKSGV